MDEKKEDKKENTEESSGASGKSRGRINHRSNSPPSQHALPSFLPADSEDGPQPEEQTERRTLISLIPKPSSGWKLYNNGLVNTSPVDKENATPLLLPPGNVRDNALYSPQKLQRPGDLPASDCKATFDQEPVAASSAARPGVAPKLARSQTGSSPRAPLSDINSEGQQVLPAARRRASSPSMLELQGLPPLSPSSATFGASPRMSSPGGRASCNDLRRASWSWSPQDLISPIQPGGALRKSESLAPELCRKPQGREDLSLPSDVPISRAEAAGAPGSGSTPGPKEGSPVHTGLTAARYSPRSAPYSPRPEFKRLIRPPSASRVTGMGGGIGSKNLQGGRFGSPVGIQSMEEKRMPRAEKTAASPAGATWQEFVSGHQDEGCQESFRRLAAETTGVLVELPGTGAESIKDAGSGEVGHTDTQRGGKSRDVGREEGAKGEWEDPEREGVPVHTIESVGPKSLPSTSLSFTSSETAVQESEHVKLSPGAQAKALLDVKPFPRAQAAAACVGASLDHKSDCSSPPGRGRAARVVGELAKLLAGVLLALALVTLTGSPVLVPQAVIRHRIAVHLQQGFEESGAHAPVALAMQATRALWEPLDPRAAASCRGPDWPWYGLGGFNEKRREQRQRPQAHILQVQAPQSGLARQPEAAGEPAVNLGQPWSTVRSHSREVYSPRMNESADCPFRVPQAEHTWLNGDYDAAPAVGQDMEAPAELDLDDPQAFLAWRLTAELEEGLLRKARGGRRGGSRRSGVGGVGMDWQQPFLEEEQGWGSDSTPGDDDSSALWGALRRGVGSFGALLSRTTSHPEGAAADSGWGRDEGALPSDGEWEEEEEEEVGGVPGLEEEEEEEEPSIEALVNQMLREEKELFSAARLVPVWQREVMEMPEHAEEEVGAGAEGAEDGEDGMDLAAAAIEGESEGHFAAGGVAAVVDIDSLWLVHERSCHLAALRKAKGMGLEGEEGEEGEENEEKEEGGGPEPATAAEQQAGGCSEAASCRDRREAAIGKVREGLVRVVMSLTDADLQLQAVHVSEPGAHGAPLPGGGCDAAIPPGTPPAPALVLNGPAATPPQSPDDDATLLPPVTQWAATAALAAALLLLLTCLSGGSWSKQVPPATRPGVPSQRRGATSPSHGGASRSPRGSCVSAAGAPTQKSVRADPLTSEAGVSTRRSAQKSAHGDGGPGLGGSASGGSPLPGGVNADGDADADARSLTPSQSSGSYGRYTAYKRTVGGKEEVVLTPVQRSSRILKTQQERDLPPGSIDAPASSSSASQAAASSPVSYSYHTALQARFLLSPQ
eukprot:jgi/Mesen1/2286/ME000154S01461